MRILLVTDWNRGQGGAENYVGWLREGLRQAGDEVRLLTSNVGTAGDGAADYIAYGSMRMAAQVFLQIRNPFAVATIKRAVEEMQPDVALVNMFAHHLSPAALGALHPVPTVLLVSDYKCVCPIGTKLLPDNSLCCVRPGWVCYQNGCVGALHWLRDQPRYALIQSKLRHATRVLACSEWMRQELARHDVESEVALLPVPLPDPSYRHEPAAEPTLVFCGRLDREKGIDLLLRAFARLHADFSSARLRIIGRGPWRAQLEEMVRVLDLFRAVEFCGWLSMAEIEAELRQAWALVVPSLWAEPLGLVAIEAIVRSVPVIASGSGGLAEIVEDNVSGLLFPNNDEGALLSRLRAIASGQAFPDHTLAETVVARTRERFSLERHVALIRRVFGELVNPPRAGGRTP